MGVGSRQLATRHDETMKKGGRQGDTVSDPSRAKIEKRIMGAKITSVLYSYLGDRFRQWPGEDTVGRMYSIELPNMPPPPGVELFREHMREPWEGAATEIYVPADAPGETPPDPMVIYDRKEGIDWSRRMLTAAAAALYREGHLDGRPVLVYLVNLPKRDHADLWMTITAEEYQV